MGHETDKAKILIVEDDAIIASDLRQILKKMGYSVLGITDSGEKAIEIIESMPPDMILMDIVIHGRFDGIQTADRVRKLFQIPVIFLTAYSDKETVEKAKLTESYGYITKPVNSNELYSTIELALYKSRMEKKLRRSEEKYRMVVENANEAIVVAQDSRIVFYNRKTLDLLHCTEKEILNAPLNRFLFPEDMHLLEHRQKRQNGHDVPVLEELRIMDKKGNPKWLANNSIVIDWRGKPATLHFITDITERKRIEKHLDERLKFETLITDLSAHLINLPPEQVDHEITRALQKIADFFGVGRSSIIQPTADGKNFEFTHSYNAKEVKPMPRSLNMAKQFPYTASQLLQGKTIRFTHLDDLPEQAAGIKAYFKKQGIKSSVTVPMNAVGQPMGALSISILDTEREWAPDLIKRLQLLADILAGAILRKKSDEQLKASEKKLSDIINSSPDAITVADLEGNIILCNQATCRLHGFQSTEEVMGRNVMAFFATEDQKRALRNTEQTLKHGDVIHEEYTLLRKDGSQFSGELSAGLHRDEHGNPVAYIGITKDITERKEMALALQQEKQFLDGIIEGLPGDFFIIDEKGTIIRWNKYREILLGYTADELRNRSAVAHIVPEDREHVAKELARVFKGESVQAEYSIQTKSGETIPFLANGTRITVNQKNYVVGLAIDITDRKNMELALRESEQRFRILYETIPMGILYRDRKGNFIGMNPEALKIFNADPKDIGRFLEGQKLIRIIREDGEPLPADELPFEIAMRTSQKVEEKTLGIISPGNPKPIWLSLRAVPLFKVGEKKPYQVYTLFEDVTDKKKIRETLENTLKELNTLKNRLQEENFYLQEEIKLEYNFEEIIGQSQPVRQVLRDVEVAAQVDTNVLILGETGTGKELIARAVHNLSSRKSHPLIKVNCAALPASLIESELFGHEKGAFTGASALQKGRFELADGGSIFLDEVAELPLEVQAKLLRVLQEGEFERIGGQGTRKIDVRVIAATNRDLKKLILEGKFRRDLYFRLNVLLIHLPPLRNRKEDIPLLTHFFVKKYSAKIGKKFEHISKKTMTALQSLDWPGNIRELENMIERAVIFSVPPTLHIEASSYDFLKEDESVYKMTSMEEVERNHILHILEQAHWTIEGKKGAAQILEINPSTLRSRMKKLGITKPK